MLLGFTEALIPKIGSAGGRNTPNDEEDDPDATCVVTERWLRTVLRQLATVEDANAELADRFQALQIQLANARDLNRTISRMLSTIKKKRQPEPP